MSNVTPADLRQVFKGPVHAPNDDGYHELRQSLKLAVDPEPALVAEASGAKDVRAALRWARDRGLPFAVQATGHGTFIPSDGGLLVRTGRMASVLVDPDRRVARVGGGARWGDVIAAAAPFDLVPLCGNANDVGVVGYTLGGGIGWLARRFGFAADSVVSAEVLTAGGDLVTASADQHPDLFWALCGGSGNFGVVTALEFRLHPLARVYGGEALFPIERAAEVIAFYRDWAEPVELTTSVVVQQTSPVESVAGPVLLIRGMYTGTAAAGRRALRPLWDAAGPPLHDGFAETRFADLTVASPGPKVFELYEDLPQPVIDGVVASVHDTVEAVEIRRWGGAMSSGPGPVGHRDVPFSIKLEGPVEAAEPILPYATGKTFLNFMPDPSRTPTAYTAPDYERLREVKRAYDPDNVLHRNLNIPPAASGSASSRLAR